MFEHFCPDDSKQLAMKNTNSHTWIFQICRNSTFWWVFLGEKAHILHILEDLGIAACASEYRFTLPQANGWTLKMMISNRDLLLQVSEFSGAIAVSFFIWFQGLEDFLLPLKRCLKLWGKLTLP